MSYISLDLEELTGNRNMVPRTVTIGSPFFL